MSLKIVVVTEVGEREYGGPDLPLRIATAPGSQIPVPGPAAALPLAVVDVLDDAPFVQPGGAEAGVTVNGEPLKAARRLRDGDEIEAYGTQIRVARGDELLRLEVAPDESRYVTAPPVVRESGEEEDADEIAPIAFRRREIEQQRAAERRGVPWYGWVGAALAVLAAMAWLLFTSTSVRLDTVPAEPGEVAISGGWFRLPLGERYLLRPGVYTVTLKTEGYHPLERRFEVGEEDSLILELVQERMPGRLVVESVPAAGAAVRIDGEEVGTTPLPAQVLEPGEYTVRVRAERYLPWEARLEVPGLDRTQTLTVQLVPAFAPVTVTSRPAGATILAGDEPLGETPATVELPEGRNELSLVREGYKPWEGRVVTFADTPVTLPTVELERADGVLRVRSNPPGANVTVDGRYRGQTPVRISLAPGRRHTIGLSKAGYRGYSRNVVLAAAQGETLDVDLTARIGEVRFSVTPGDAEIFVDGRSVGRGDTRLELPAEPQALEVRREGYETWQGEVTPRPGFPQTVNIRLRTLEEARLASIPQRITTSQGAALRYVTPGEFMMGASRREPGRRANENLRRVRITRPFYIGVNEVTNREFLAFREAHDSGADTHPALAGDNNPVASVSWQDAAAFANWLSSKEGLTPVYEEKFGKLVPIRPLPDGYRLPTEAEWAWAARYQGGAGKLKYPWGREMPPPEDSGNYADQAAKEIVPTVLPRYNDGFASTAPVGTFPANALGLYDTGGNVAEWINDYYAVYTGPADDVAVDPFGPDSATHRVIRGSSWQHSGITQLRLSFRDFGTDPRTDVGFRLVRNAPE
ncbi:MAG TPA: PEGA domain-containing protein [Woeseiaceae bacterium]|nr:PEGA domain-containing protein [Woeseiaceae bacterium]